jgi:hypothetical protein
MYIEKDDGAYEIIAVPWEDALPGTMPGNHSQRSKPQHIATTTSQEWAVYLTELLGDEYTLVIEASAKSRSD